MGSYKCLEMFKRISMSLSTTKNTVTADKIPLVYREPGIIYGYRLQHQPIKFYVKSMFQIHNETVNIWTHMIAMYTGCHEDHYAMLEDYFLSGVVVMSWVGFICCCIAKLRYRRPYPPYMKLWNICSFGFQYTSVFTVVLARYYDCWVNNTLSTLNHHTIATSYVILSICSVLC